MFQKNTNISRHSAAGRSKRDGLGALLRKPMVQGCLLLTAVAQVVASVGAEKQSQEAPRVAVLAPMLVQPEGAGVGELWAHQATEREAKLLAQKYRMEGYPVSSDLAETITEAAVEHGIDLDIAFGLVRAESSFRNTATSTVGAVGLTQLMPATARWIQPGVSRSALRDPETNLKVGFKYLRYLLEKYEGDENLALLAYNRGPGTVDRALRRGRNPDNGYAAFVKGEKDHGHKLFTE